MRRFCLLPLAALLLPSSCQLLSESVEATPSYIEFLVVADPYQSRGEVVNSYLDFDNFGVYGYVGRSAEPLFDDLFVQRHVREWLYESPLLWDEVEDFSSTFFAYSPHCSDSESLSVECSTSALKLHYRASEDSSSHPYVMISFPVVREVGDTDPIRFVMQHPLTVVSFSLSDDVDTPPEWVEVVGVSIEASLILNIDGSFEWGESEGVGSVRCTLDDSMMMIPHTLPADALLRVHYADRSVEYSIGGDVWGINKRVGYTIAADSVSLYST